MKHRVDHWLPCGLEGPRAASAEQVATVLQAEGVQGPLPRFATPRDAFRQARESAGEDGRIVAFGSFLTVAQVMRCLATNP
jgi:dihydrofolate synthase/folylpolyglutamate synthase